MKTGTRLWAAAACCLIFPAMALGGTNNAGQPAPATAPIKLIKMEPHLDIPSEVEKMFYTPGRPLMGEIKHSQFLPPVDKSLRPGAHFDETMLSNFRPNDLWMWVPPWLAGTYSTVYHKQVFTYDFRWHRIKRETAEEISLSHDDFGQQKDKLGNVWTYLGCPYSNRILTGDGYVYQIYSHVEPVLLSSKCIVFKASYSAVHVNVHTHQVGSVVQFEGLSSRKPIDDSHVLVEDSFKSFDQDGRPLKLSRTTAIAVKNSGFSPVNQVHGIDQRTSLKNFFLLHDMESLVP